MSSWEQSSTQWMMMVEMQTRMNVHCFKCFRIVGIDSINNPTYKNISNLKKLKIKNNYTKKPKSFFVKCCKRMTYIKEKKIDKTENGNDFFLVLR
jgi:hypothetical protein